jgi:leucyl-tRNA synthetase
MGDVVARYKRAKGYNVLHPMGWDAFGMPAENAAMQNKVHPGNWTYANIDTMREQLKLMGLSIDWSREFATCDVDYYHRQQMLFLDFLEKDLVYRKQVQGQLGPGRHDRARQRTGHRRTRLALRCAGRTARTDPVVLQDHRFRRMMLDSLDELDEWPEKVRVMQKNWIGRSEGLQLRWEIERSGASRRDRAGGLHHPSRHDFGASFMAIAADHPLAGKPRRKSGLAEFCDECRRAGTSSPHSRPRRRRARHRHSRRSSASIRTGRCRSMSPISC